MENKVLGYTKEKVWQPKYKIFLFGTFASIISYASFTIELSRILFGLVTLILIFTVSVGFAIEGLLNFEYVPVTKFKPKE